MRHIDTVMPFVTIVFALVLFLLLCAGLLVVKDPNDPEAAAARPAVAVNPIA